MFNNHLSVLIKQLTIVTLAFAADNCFIQNKGNKYIHLFSRWQVILCAIVTFLLNRIIQELSFLFFYVSGPGNPNCTCSPISTNSSSLTVNVQDLHATGALKYRVTMLDLIVESNKTLTFPDLKPGTNYSISVMAIGAGNMTSLTTCSFSAFTSMWMGLL